MTQDTVAINVAPAQAKPMHLYLLSIVTTAANGTTAMGVIDLDVVHADNARRRKLHMLVCALVYFISILVIILVLTLVMP